MTDSAGAARLAPLYYVSLAQIDFVIPSNTANGLATVTVTNASGENGVDHHPGHCHFSGPVLDESKRTRRGGRLRVDGPCGWFAVRPEPAVSVRPEHQPVRADPDRLEQLDRPAVPDAVRHGLRGEPPEHHRNYQRDLVPVIYAGQQPQFHGEDQVNLGPIPTSLKGRRNGERRTHRKWPAVQHRYGTSSSNINHLGNRTEGAGLRPRPFLLGPSPPLPPPPLSLRSSLPLRPKGRFCGPGERRLHPGAGVPSVP